MRSIPSLYESSFGYFLNEVREYKEAKTIETFYSDPKKWFNPSRRNGMSQFAHNHLAFDLGYPTETVGEQNHAASDQIANEIVSTFDLILIRFVASVPIRVYFSSKYYSYHFTKIFSDYFFESMILLKHSFCWDWMDVLYFVTNQRANRKERSASYISMSSV